MKKTRLAAMLMAIVMVVSMCSFAPWTDNTVSAAENLSEELMVFGNKVVVKNSPQRVIRLSGVNVPGGEWTGTPAKENVERSTIYAIDKWNCNVIRLAVGIEGWYGDYSYVNDGGNGFRNYIDQVISRASERGAYVVLDLHEYKGFNNKKYLDFWTEAATKYKNNPTVLFGILNEPHGINWETWRNGGSGYTGHQQVVELIRDLGAKNIIVAGGLDWGYNLTGIMKGYALVDQGSNNNKELAGNGIIYDTHIYPWKGRTSNWHNSVGVARLEHPILVGECGWDPATNKSVGGKEYKPGDVMYHDKWVPEFLAWIDNVKTYGNYANYTAYSFHPSSAPRMLVNDGNWGNDNYAYPPTDYWGAYVKDFLVDNLSTRYTVLGPPAKIAIRDPRLYYQVGDTFDNQNGIIMAYDELGNFYEIPFSDKDVKFTGFNSSKAVQSQKITVDYLGTKAYFEVNISNSMLMGSSAPSKVEKRYLSIDFEDAVADAADSIKFNMTNKADNSAYSIQTYQTLTGSRNAYRIMTNSTSCLRSPSKAGTPYDIVMPSVVAKEDGRVYVDMRLYRTSTSDDPVTLSLVDSNDNKIFTLKYESGTAPALIASQEYSAGDAYPTAQGWRHIRAIINFDMKTFELYQGESFDALNNFVTGTNFFTFENTAARDLNRITNYNLDGASYDGSLGFDDIDVYTVATAPKYVWPATGITVKDVVTNYQTYDELDTSVGSILIAYANGIVKEVPFDSEGVSVTGFDSMIDGKQTLTVKYMGFTTTYDVYVAHYTYMTGIRAEGLKDVYSIGDNLDTSVGYLYLDFSDGSFETLPMSNTGITVSGFSSITTGEKVLTLTYGNFRTTYTITVVPDVSSITVSGLKDSYSLDEPIDFEKTLMTINYINGTTGTMRLDAEGVAINKRTLASSPDDITIIITYRSKRYTHKAKLVDSIYDWELSLGDFTTTASALATTVTFGRGTKDADLVMYAKDFTGKTVSVGVFPIKAGTTNLEVILTSDVDLGEATIYAVMWDSASNMVPVSYKVFK